MALIDTAALLPGMTLAEDLHDHNGRFILGKGTQLSDNHLKIIKTWGIVEAKVHGSPSASEYPSDTIKPEIIQKAQAHTGAIFSKTNFSDDAVQKLYQICIQRNIKLLADNNPQANAQQAKDPVSLATAIPKDLVPSKGVNPHVFIKQRIKLASLPIIFHKLNEAIGDPKSSASDIASIISKDTSLTAILLKLVNSSFYGFANKVESIARAVTIVGTQQLNALAIGTCAIDIFKGFSSEHVNMRSFWEHSIACGILARIIASYKNDINNERLFLAGLLHDIGRLIIFRYMPAHSQIALMEAHQTNTMLYEMENKWLGFDHSILGALLLKEWQFPLLLEHTIGNHHATGSKQSFLEASIVHLADIIANALEIGSSGERYIPPLSTEMWDAIGISTGTLSAIIELAEHHITDTIQIFFPFKS
jgi:putative nucleotidyltransferase with HDIG domain